MTYLAKSKGDDIEDAGFCLVKEAEYAAKAKATNDRALRSAYEAAAREYAYRAMLLKETKKSA